MPIEITGMDDIYQSFLSIDDELPDDIVKMLKDLGEHCIVEARTKGTYKDQTGNLRKSIGYGVFLDGVLVEERYQEGVGADKAKEYMQTIANQSSKKYALIVVAGMDYASDVQARGYDVLISAQLEAETTFPNALALVEEEFFKRRGY